MYHLQADGQTEWVNQELEQYLQLFTSKRQDDWADLLSMAEFQYNNHIHSSTQQTPFLLDSGQHPQIGHDMGNPWVTRPLPTPVWTHTHEHGYGFRQVWVWVLSHHITSPSPIMSLNHPLTYHHSTTTNNRWWPHGHVTTTWHDATKAGGKRCGQGWASCPSLKLSVLYFNMMY